MERDGKRSSEAQGVIIKKRNSSGCLIVKKRDEVGRICSFSENCSNWGNLMERKRSRKIMGDSESSDKFTILHKNCVEHNLCHYRNVEETHFGLRRDRVEGKGDSFVGNSRELKKSKKHILDDSEEEKDDDDDDDESEDELLTTRMRRSFDGNGVDIGKKTYMGSTQFGIDKEHGTGSSSKDLGVEKRRNIYLDVLALQKKHKRVTSFDGLIRVQGKNGVLKVMMKKHNKMEGLVQNFTDVDAEKSQYGSKAIDTDKIHVAIQSSTTIKSDNMAKHVPPTIRIHSNGLKSKGHDQDSEDNNTLGRMQSRIIQSQKPFQMPSTGAEKNLPEELTPPEIRDGKIRHGLGTKKQRLRERIREMLLEARWTIDYRPRRNRDYLDAVYISPKGTAYWSIIKAYEALLKQVNSGEKVVKSFEDNSAFTLISDEILNQLTRKTKRNIEKDMKMQVQRYESPFPAMRNEVGSCYVNDK